MMRSAISRNTVLVAGLVALVYASLAVMAASCALRHGDPSNGHTHHGSDEAAPHNALCAWACQVTSDAGLVPEPPTLAMSLIVRFATVPPHQEIPPSSFFSLRPRAPRL
jgi:hypothetical protein